MLAKLSMIAVTLLGLTACRGVMRASDVYIAQNATGANNGNDCGDAHDTSFFNNGGNWGSGAPIGPGTTVHLCGTITSELTVQGSGNSGNAIEVLFEPGASIQVSPGCDSNGCVNLGSHSYIVLDGGHPCGWDTAKNVTEGTCNGRIENMRYGSSDATCPGGPCIAQPNASVGNLIQGSGGSGIEIRNLEAGPSYIHTSTGNGGDDAGGTQGILLFNGSNWKIHDSKCHDAVWCVVLVYSSGSASNWSIANNEEYNDSHMNAIGGSGTASLNGVAVSGNYSHDMSNWNTSSDYDHANFFHMYGSPSTSATNISVNNNIAGGTTGQNMTAQIFSEAQSSVTNFHVYNNLVYSASGLFGGERLLLWSMCTSGCAIYNNTFDGNTTANGTCVYLTGIIGNVTVKNNIIANCFVDFYAANTVSFASLNNNAYGTSTGENWDYNGVFYNVFSQWQAASGEGSSSAYYPSGISLSPSYKLNAGSPLAGTGANLSGLGIAALDSDLAGIIRPAGAWAPGAYALGGSGVGAPTPPTALTAAVH